MSLNMILGHVGVEFDGCTYGLGKVPTWLESLVGELCTGSDNLPIFCVDDGHVVTTDFCRWYLVIVILSQ
jgi:hypothetical protein